MVDIDPEMAQAVILEHYRKPRNQGRCEGANVLSGDTTNPACGDEVSVTLTVESGKITCARFQGQGCAVSLAGASLVISSLEGDSTLEAETKLGALLLLLEQESDAGCGCESLDQLALVRAHPARRVCALLTARLVLRLLRKTQEN
jgi:nitrogen fixation protein NifU and related proteins